MDETTGGGYSIIKQSEDYRRDDAGEYGHGIVVTFITSGGNRGSIFVPDDQYTVDTVRRLVAARAAKMDAVGSIVG